LFIEEAHCMVNVYIIIILWRSWWTPHLQTCASNYDLSILCQQK
jgi:hypothetical protein